MHFAALAPRDYGYLSPGGPECTRAAGRLAGLTTEAWVVEIGCGLGEAAMQLAAGYGCYVLATDIDPIQLSEAARRVRRRRLQARVRLAVADGTRLPCPDGVFTLALAEGSPLSFIGRARGLAEMARVLRPGGTAAVTDFIRLREQLSPAVARVFGDSQFRFETEAAYRDLFASAGFEIVYLTYVPRAGWDRYYAYIGRLSHARRGIFRDGLIRAALRAEMTAFYEQGGCNEVGYGFIVGRKRKSEHDAGW